MVPNTAEIASAELGPEVGEGDGLAAPCSGCGGNGGRATAAVDVGGMLASRGSTRGWCEGTCGGSCSGIGGCMETT